MLSVDFVKAYHTLSREFMLTCLGFMRCMWCAQGGLLIHTSAPCLRVHHAMYDCCAADVLAAAQAARNVSRRIARIAQ